MFFFCLFAFAPLSATMTTRVLMQVIQDRTMAMNNSFVPALERLSKGMKFGKLQAVTMVDSTRCYMWDGCNTPFRPSKLVRVVLPDGYFVLFGDDGGYTDRKIKVGGTPQADAQVILPLDLPGVNESNYLSTVLTERHCVSVVTPHCVCCMKRRSVQGYRFCAFCKDPSHLYLHYFPHAGCLSSCCLHDSDRYDCCIPCTDLSFEYGTHRMSNNGNFFMCSTCDYEHLPHLPMDVILLICKYLHVPCFGSDFLEAWNEVSRDGTLLSLRVNFEVRSLYKSTSPADFEDSKLPSDDPYGNPGFYYSPSVYIENEDDDSISVPDPYVSVTKVGESNSNIVFLNRDPMFPNGIRVSNDQGMPVSINLEIATLDTDGYESDETIPPLRV